MAIAIIAVAIAATETYANVQWFAGVNDLDLRVGSLTFRFDVLPTSDSFVTVNASLSNPSGTSNLVLRAATYVVFVDPANFSAQGSSEVGVHTRDFNVSSGRVPTQGILDLSYTFILFPDLTSSPQSILQSYVNSHNQTGLITYVQITLYFLSSYGRLGNNYCYALPSNTIQICPEPRSPVTGKAPGG